MYLSPLSIYQASHVVATRMIEGVWICLSSERSHLKYAMRMEGTPKVESLQYLTPLSSLPLS